jgi:hypothetical protein
MFRHTGRFVLAVVVAALASAALVYARAPQVDASRLAAALSFAAMAVLVQVLSHRVSHGSAGSISFIPYLASALVTTSWVSVLGATIATAAVEVYRRRAIMKIAFNTAQVALVVSVSLMVYLGAGGRALLEEPSLNFIPYVGLVVTFFFLNALLVSGVIATVEKTSVLSVLHRNSAGSVTYDILASPVAYVFGWVYTVYGPGWAAALAFPLLAIRQIYKTNSDLERTHHELLQLMVKAIEARDPYTSGHSQRVANYSKAIGRRLGLGNREVQKITDAALLHDVGKIHEIYAPILRKPGKLSPEEWQVMQTHPIKSEELVQTVSSLKDLLGSIRHHHENWDGTGYPDQIAGEDIPLGARIITFADTIDAMTTDRPYRKALGADEVRSEIVRLRGVQFDPSLCDTILKGPFLASLIEGPTRSVTPSFTPVLVPRSATTTPRARAAIGN